MLFSGLIVGAIIRYAGTKTAVLHLPVEPEAGSTYNKTLPPDSLWLTVIHRALQLYPIFLIALSVPRQSDAAQRKDHPKHDVRVHVSRPSRRFGRKRD